MYLAKFLLWVSTDDVPSVFMLSFFKFTIGTDVGLNKSSVPIWIFGMNFHDLRLGSDLVQFYSFILQQSFD